MGSPVTKLKMDRVKLEHCTQVLNQAQTSFKRDIWATYNINKNALVTGVFCPFCSNGGMVRHLQKWYCNACGTFSYNAHIAALNDYKVLISDLFPIERPDVSCIFNRLKIGRASCR